MPSVTRHASRALIVLSTLYAAAQLIIGPRWTADDAYIVARYAKNLAQHGRLAWNLDGAPVEGFTGFALPLLMTAAELLRLSPIRAATGVGVVSLFAGAALVHACHRPLGAGPLAGALGFSAYLLVGEQTTHALSGLETELFIALTVACAWAALRTTAREGERRPSVALPLLAAGCALTRPEGAVVGGAFLVAVLFRERARWKAWLPVAGVGFVAPLLASEAFRWAYYGSWLPNTYYAKRSVAYNGQYLASFARFLGDYLVPSLVAFSAVLVVARAIGARGSNARDRPARDILLFGCAASFLVVGLIYSRSELVMGYSSRFAFHVFGPMVLLVVLAAGEVTRMVAAMGDERAVLRGVVGALATAALALGLIRGIRNADEERHFRRAYRDGAAAAYVPVARWLLDNVSAPATIAYYPDAGIVPYLVGLRALDFGKLNDVFLAREARTDEDVADYFFRMSPDVLVMTQAPGPPNAQGLAKAKDATADHLLADPRFSAYRLAELFATSSFGLGVYVKR